MSLDPQRDLHRAPAPAGPDRPARLRLVDPDGPEGPDAVVAPPRRRALPVLLGGACTAYLLLLLLVTGPQRGLVASAVLCLGQGLCGAALLVPRRTEGSALRRVWLLAGIAMVCSAGIFAVWTFYAARDGSLPPAVSLADGFFVLAVLSLLAAGLAWPTSRQAATSRRRFLLDASALALALLLLYWVQVVQPGLPGGDVSASLTGTVLPVLYPLLDLLTVAAALSAFRVSGPVHRRSALCLLAAACVFLVGDTLLAAGLTAGTWEYDTVPMLLFLLAPVLLVLGRWSGGAAEVQVQAHEGRATDLARASAFLLVLPVGFALLSGIANPGTGTTVIGSSLIVLLLVRHAVVELTSASVVEALEDDVQTEAAFLHATLRHLSQPVLACDADGRVRFANDAFVALFPHTSVGGTLVTARPSEQMLNLDGTPMRPADLPLGRALRGEHVESSLLLARHDDGTQRVLRESAAPIRRASMAVAGAVLVTQDVTAAHAVEDELRRRASTDLLTGLGNRADFADRLLACLRDTDPATCAVLLLDLDDFKNVNDSLGHATGDELLVVVADRIRQVLRAQDHAARLGGDEFGLLLLGVDEQEAVVVATRLLDGLDAPLTLAEVELSVSASVGVAMGDAVGDAQELMGAADLAMYLAKRRGKGGVAVFEPHMQESARDRLSLENDLRRAVRNRELHLAYQPIVDLTTGVLTGVEALVRWQHPERGFVSPVDFIPVAEASGLILPLGEWVLQEAVAQLARWNADFPGSRLVVSVNVSSRQLERHGLLTEVDRLVARGLDPAQLVVEITETALGLDDAATMETLHALRDRGIHLAVDDFGTGYSSLSRLRAAPVNRLKIDRSFVNEIVHGGSHVPIVDATLAMARGLGLGVVAEGVETTAQLDYLQRLGCGQAQGYLLARPMPADGISDILAGPVPWSQVVSTRPVRGSLSSEDELSHLLDLTLASEVDVEGLIRPLLAELQRVTGADVTYLTRITADGTEQELAYLHAGAESWLPEGVTAALEESLCLHALASGITQSNDVAGDFPGSGADELGVTTYVTAPVYRPDGRLFGTLCGASREAHALTEADTPTVRLFARLVEEKLRATTPTPLSQRGVPGAPDPASLHDRRRALQQRRQSALARWHARRSAPAARAEPDQSRRGLALNRQAHDVLVQRASELESSAADEDLSLLRVMVADDDALIRMIVAHLIEEEAGLRMAVEAHTGAATIGIAVAEQPDLIVLDFDLGDMTAMSVIPELRQFAPGSRILLHSGRDDVHQIGLRLGVDRAVRKQDGPDRLRDALHDLAAAAAWRQPSEPVPSSTMQA